MASICDEYCDGCIYSQREGGSVGLRICTYYLVTDIRRPCPAGSGCTVRKNGRKANRWSYEANNTWQQKKTTAQRNDDYTEKLRQIIKAQKIMSKQCKECGETFITDNPSRAYCSIRCKNRIAQRKYYERKKANEG